MPALDVHGTRRFLPPFGVPASTRDGVEWRASGAVNIVHASPNDGGGTHAVMPDALADETRLIAITGARAATGYGEHVAMQLVAGLAHLPRVAVITGGAYGIDGAVMRACRANGVPLVIFLAGGLGRVYPAGHQTLIEDCIDKGAVLLAARPDDELPTRDRFLTRNMLMGQIADDVVIVEAGPRSGALSVAHHARAAGRTVWAVPGPVTSAASAGCHALIADGARILTSGSDLTI